MKNNTKIIIILILIIFIFFNSLNKNETFSNINNISNTNNKYLNWFNDNIDLYYINLEESTDRKKSIENQLNRLNVNYNRFNAYNGKLINDDFKNELSIDYKLFNTSGDIYKNKKGSLGNYLSQLTCWYNYYKNSEKKYIMVMEDDIIIDDDFNLKYVYDVVNSIDNWDMIKFNHFGKQEGKNINKYLYKGVSNCDTCKPNTGMQMYMISKKSVPLFVDNMFPIKNLTFDWAVKKLMNKLDIYITTKNNVSHKEFKSIRKEINNEI